MNVPVFIRSSDEEQTSTLYTKAKLKIFYIGETADHRLFTRDFADKIKKIPSQNDLVFLAERVKRKTT